MLITVGVMICVSINLKISNTSYRSENQNIELRDQESSDHEQHNPSLKNTTESESGKEIASDEQVENRTHCVGTESSKYESDVSNNIKPEKRKRRQLHLRSDVVNKTLLRAVKRFYSSKFKMLQKSMVQKRFRNVKAARILDALTKF